MKWTMTRSCGFLVALLLGSVPGCMRQSTGWKDPSKHYVQFVTVDKDVQLEVLDWGGVGRPVVLLAGFGNSAHVFDEFAEKLIETNRVYGITRRGFGWSSHPASGYDVQRLAKDILNVLDALKIESPVLAGHSYAGNEMAILGERSDRIAGLVFMDALNDPTYDWTERNKIQGRFPSERYPMPHVPRGETNPSFEDYLAWQRVGRRDPFPESEIRATSETTPTGRMGMPRTTSTIRMAISAGTPKPDYSTIKVPSLAFVAYPISVEEQLQNYQIEDDQDRKAVEDLYAADQKYLKEFTDNFQRAVPDARVLRMAGARHYVFISNPTDVLFEMRRFMGRLPQ
jgi:pimeloyl-ACP methyl ester carboxylesterase